MKLNPGQAEEYKKRHDEIWPELQQLLKGNGISDYSIFLDEETNILFAVQKQDGKSSQDLGSTDIVKKWWAYIRIDDKSVLASRIILEVLKQEYKNNGVLISYSENEKKLLEYLEENEKITLKEFSKLLRSSYRKAQKVLVNLILTNVIKSHTSEKEEYFTVVR